ncbi:MAG: hypothetical protein MUC42_11635, partial [Bryobacter sp.]|nr:hypothetical protein [Bryobacter sp.]
MKSGIRHSGLMIVPLALMAVHAEASTVTTFLNTQTLTGSVSGPGLNSGGSFSNNLSSLGFINGVAIGTLVRGTKITGDALFTNDDAFCNGSGCTIDIVAEGDVLLDGAPAPGAYLKYDFNVYLQQILSINSFSISPQ